MFIYPTYYHNWKNISTIYIYIWNMTNIKRNILTIKKINRAIGRAKDLSARRYTNVTYTINYFTFNNNSKLCTVNHWSFKPSFWAFLSLVMPFSILLQCTFLTLYCQKNTFDTHSTIMLQGSDSTQTAWQPVTVYSHNRHSGFKRN